MNLLAPFNLCLQCLPVFSSESPPPSPSPSSVKVPNLETNLQLHGSSTPPAYAASSSVADCALAEGEEPSFSDASLIHDNDQKDLPISEQAKVELVVASHASSPSVPVVDHVYASRTPGERSSPTGDMDNTQIHVSEPASHHEISHSTAAPSDSIEFSTSGMKSLPSPITPAPIGLGYIVGQLHAASEHIHHQVSSHYNGGHSFSPIRSHDKAHPTQEMDPLKPPSPGDQHLSPSASSPPCPPIESSTSKQGDLNPQPHEKDMETSFSLPHITNVSSHAEKSDDDTDTFGPATALVTSHSEPVEATGTGRVRRRDHLKHHLKELHGQLKQGGHLLKEEGSRHLQSMVTNINKQAEQLEESGSFFMVPRWSAS